MRQGKYLMSINLLLHFLNHNWELCDGPVECVQEWGKQLLINCAFLFQQLLQVQSTTLVGKTKAFNYCVTSHTLHKYNLHFICRRTSWNFTHLKMRGNGPYKHIIECWRWVSKTDCQMKLKENPPYPHRQLSCAQKQQHAPSTAPTQKWIAKEHHKCPNSLSWHHWNA